MLESLSQHDAPLSCGTAGAYLLSTLDNGVVSSESWHIIDAADDLSFVLLHYKGAARVVGQRYRGAVLGSRTGRTGALAGPRRVKTLPPPKSTNRLFGNVSSHIKPTTNGMTSIDSSGQQSRLIHALFKPV